MVRIFISRHNLKLISNRSNRASRYYHDQSWTESIFQRRRKIEVAISPYVPSSAADLAKHLSENIIYHKKDDLLAIEKPYGVSCLGYIQKGHGVFGYSRQDDEQKESQEYNARKVDLPTIEDAIPYLKEHFHEPGLHFCMGLKRWVSGPIILPCNTQANKRICHSVFQGNSISHSTKTAPAQHMFKALAICISKPNLDKGTIVGYATYQKTTQTSEYIFVEGTIPKRARNANLAAQGEISYNVLDSRYGLSLVDLHFSKFTKHFPRLFLSYLGTPVLFDWIYMRRLIDIDQKPTLIDPKNISRGGKNYEPIEFLQMFGLNQLNELKPASTTQIPLLMAVYHTVLPFWGDSKVKRALTELRLTIPPPEHFLKMADLLNFTPAIKHVMDLCESEKDENNLEIKKYKSRKKKHKNNHDEKQTQKAIIGGDTKF